MVMVKEHDMTNPIERQGQTEPKDVLEEALEGERNKLEEKMRCLLKEITDAQRRFKDAEDRLNLVAGLLGQNQDQLTRADDPSGQVGRQLTSKGRAPTASVTSIAKEILSEQPGDPPPPMYYKDLAREILNRGGDLYGNNPPQMLVAQLVRDEDFVRPEHKGYYALTKDYPKARNVGARKRRGGRKSS